MLHHQSYNSRSHLLSHHNILGSPKAIVPTSSGLRPGPTPLVSVAQNTQSHLVQGFQQASYQTQRISADKTTLGNRLSYETAGAISGFLVSAQGERQVDFKTVGEDFMRIKDLSSEYCYKFRVTSQVPAIQLNPNDNLRLFLSFSGDYTDDLFKFLTALEDSRFSLRQGERVAVLEFRFTSVQFKNQLIEIIQSVGRRGSFPLVQTPPSLGNYRSVSAIVNHPVEHQAVTIQTINQGHRSERNNVVQHVNVNQISEGGVTGFKRIDVQPPVALAPFPVQQIHPVVQTTQQTFVTQRVSEPAQQIGIVSSTETTQVIRLTEQVRVLNSTIRTVQQESQLVIQENNRLNVEITNLRQQIEVFRSESGTRTHYNEGEALRYKNQLSIVTQSLTAAEKRLKQVQLQLSQSKTSQVNAKNQRETLRINFTRQVSELQTKINIISGSSTSSSTQITSLRRQYEEQKNSNFHLETELSKLRQLLAQAESNLFEYEGRENNIRHQLGAQLEQETHILNQAVEERNHHIRVLEEQLFQAQQSVGVTAHTVHVQANAQFSNELEIERQKFIEEYEILRVQKSREIEHLTIRLEEVIAEDERKLQAIHQLEDQLNNTIHSQDLSRSNANFEAEDKVRSYYEEQLLNSKNIFENEAFQLNEQISYYQKLAEEYQTKYGGLLDEYRTLSSAQKTETYESVTTSQSTHELALRNQIAALEHERLQLISIVQRYQLEAEERANIVIHQQAPVEEYVEERVTYTTYQQGGSRVGGENQVVERVVYRIGDNNEVVQTTTFASERQEQGIVQTESIERITTQITTGEEQLETIERVTYQQDNGYDQQITTYQINDGEERYIHKVTTDSIQGRAVHQIDTNIVVHQEGGELVYDIDTEETNYGNAQQIEGYQGYQQYQQLGHSDVRSSLYQEESQSNSYAYNQNYESSYSQEQTIYHGDNVEVVYDNEARNIVIEGADYEINIPDSGARKITITEETYQEMDNLF